MEFLFGGVLSIAVLLFACLFPIKRDPYGLYRLSYIGIAFVIVSFIWFVVAICK